MIFVIIRINFIFLITYILFYLHCDDICHSTLIISQLLHLKITFMLFILQ